MPENEEKMITKYTDYVIVSEEEFQKIVNKQEQEEMFINLPTIKGVGYTRLPTFHKYPGGNKQTVAYISISDAQQYLKFFTEP